MSSAPAACALLAVGVRASHEVLSGTTFPCGTFDYHTLMTGTVAGQMRGNVR